MAIVADIMGRLDRMAMADRDTSEVREQVDGSLGDSVSPEFLLRDLDGSGLTPYDLLEGGERVHYILRGNSSGSWGTNLTLVTDQRILIISDHMTGYEGTSVDYDSVRSVMTNKGMFSKRLTFYTDSTAFHLSASNSDMGEVRLAAQYIRELCGLAKE